MKVLRNPIEGCDDILDGTLHDVCSGGYRHRGREMGIGYNGAFKLDGLLEIDFERRFGVEWIGPECSPESEKYEDEEQRGADASVDPEAEGSEGEDEEETDERSVSVN